MNKRIVKFLAAALCFGACWAAFSIRTPDDSAAFWETVLRHKEVKLKHLREEAEYWLALLDRDLATFNKFRDVEKKKFAALDYILKLVGRNPYEYRLITRVILSDYRLYSSNMEDLRGTATLLKRFTLMFDEMLIDIRNLRSTGELSPETLRSLDAIEKHTIEIRDHLDLSLRNLTVSLQFSEALREVMEKEVNQIRERSHAKMVQFILNRHGSVVDSDLWNGVVIFFNDWVADLPSTFFQKFPDSFDEWLLFALALGLGCLPAGLGHYYFSARRKRTDEKSPAFPFLVRCWWYLWAILALWATGFFLIYPETVVSQHLEIILLARLGMDLGQGMSASRHGRAGKSPLEPLFWLFAAGIAFQILNFNFCMLILSWSVSLAICLYFQFRISGSDFDLIDRILSRISIGINIFLLLVTMIGFAYLANFALLIWFMILVGFNVGTFLSLWLRQTLIGFKQGKAEILKALTLGMGIPAMWLGIITGVSLWIAEQIGMTSPLEKVLSIKVSMSKTSTLDLPSLIAVVFFFFVFNTTSNVLRSSVARIYGVIDHESHKIDEEKGLVPSLKLLISYVLWSLYALLALKLLGFGMTNLAYIGGGLGIGIGFGLREIINNFVSGLIILLGRSLHQGDIIQIGDSMAKVIKINIRSTVVQTYDNAIVTIPNSNVISNQLINWTRNNATARRDVKIGVAYGSDVAEVKRSLIEVAAENPRVLKSPAPKVLFMDFGDSALQFYLRIWIDDIDDYTDILSSLREGIDRKFREKGIEIAFPQLDVHLPSAAGTAALR